MNEKHHPLVRAIYLYLFALVGLALLTIGTVRFVDMGLKAFVFTKAEEQQRLYQGMPPVMPYPPAQIEELQEEGLSEEEKALVKQWLADYKDWKERRAKFDLVTAQRHRNASINLAMILVGLPLYLFHWRIIRRETK
ncbi:MAG: hypothetical protein U9R11_05175 [Chloroflexota bacterium]|nr:hypothetical protein [Chloroflexota bacterium]